MKKTPVIDLSECSYCESCISLCPDVFYLNEETGVMETAEMDEYPEEDVQSAISCCPEDCIRWEAAD